MIRVILILLTASLFTACAQDGGGAHDFGQATGAVPEPAPMAACSYHDQGYHVFCDGQGMLATAYDCGAHGDLHCWRYDHTADAANPTPKTETTCAPLNTSGLECSWARVP